MDVHMLARCDRRDDAPDIDTVLDRGVVCSHRPDGEFVPDGNVADSFEGDGLVLIHDPAVQRVSRLDTFHHNDTDGVSLVVNNKMNSHKISSIIIYDILTVRPGS